MARPKNDLPPKRIELGLPVAAYECIEDLVTQGYGANPTEVVRFLVLREIDDLKRAGVLKPPAASSQPNSG